MASMTKEQEAAYEQGRQAAVAEILAGANGSQIDSLSYEDGEPLWDEIFLPSVLAVGEYPFFKYGKGELQNPADTASGKKSYVHTNMETNGKLANGKIFLIQAIQFIPRSGSAVADIVKVMNDSFLEFRVGGQNSQFRCPTRMLTAGAGIYRTDASSPTVGTPDPRAVTRIPDGILIGHPTKEITFEVALCIPASVGNLSADLRVMLLLQGRHKKNAGKQS